MHTDKRTAFQNTKYRGYYIRNIWLSPLFLYSYYTIYCMIYLYILPLFQQLPYVFARDFVPGWVAFLHYRGQIIGRRCNVSETEVGRVWRYPQYLRTTVPKVRLWIRYFNSALDIKIYFCVFKIKLVLNCFLNENNRAWKPSHVRLLFVFI